MICPKCNRKYDEGHTNCNKCGIRLVSEQNHSEGRPPLEESSDSFVPVLETYSIINVAIIKSILDQEDMEYYFLGEHSMLVQPMIIPARLMVRRDQAEEAAGLLKDLELNAESAESSIDEEDWQASAGEDSDGQPEEDK